MQLNTKAISILNLISDDINLKLLGMLFPECVCNINEIKNAFSDADCIDDHLNALMDCKLITYYGSDSIGLTVNAEMLFIILNRISETI